MAAGHADEKSKVTLDNNSGTLKPGFLIWRGETNNAGAIIVEHYLPDTPIFKKSAQTDEKEKKD